APLARELGTDAEPEKPAAAGKLAGVAALGAAALGALKGGKSSNDDGGDSVDTPASEPKAVPAQTVVKPAAALSASPSGDRDFPDQVQEDKDRKELPSPVGTSGAEDTAPPMRLEDATLSAETVESFMTAEADMELPEAKDPTEIDPRPQRDGAGKPELYVVETKDTREDPVKPAAALDYTLPEAEIDAARAEESKPSSGLLGRLMGRGGDSTNSTPEPAPEAPKPTPPKAAKKPTAQDDKRSSLRIIRNEPDQPAAPPAPLQLGEVDFDEDDEPSLRNFAVFNKAETLTDLVEVTAAYTTLIEGQPNFSRRALLERIDEVAADKNYSAEVRIKSFGKLMRAGKIIRVDDGQFSLSGEALRTFESRLAG
ncbi:MAG: hypothetical protein AAFR93_12320, partial [Pseudomonadota bacterium]